MPPLTRRRTGSSQRVRYYESASDQSDDSFKDRNKQRKDQRQSKKKTAVSDSDFDGKSDSSESSESSSSVSVASEVNVDNEASEASYEEFQDVSQTIKLTQRPKLRLFPKDLLSVRDDEILEEFRSCMPRDEVEYLKSQLPPGPELANLILHELSKRGSHFVGMYLRSSWWGYKQEVVKDFLSRLQAAAVHF